MYQWPVQLPFPNNSKEIQKQHKDHVFSNTSYQNILTLLYIKWIANGNLKGKGTNETAIGSAHK